MCARARVWLGWGWVDRLRFGFDRVTDLMFFFSSFQRYTGKKAPSTDDEGVPRD